jgi:hypothetical protein
MKDSSKARVRKWIIVISAIILVILMSCMVINLVVDHSVQKTRTELCKQLADYISKDECMNQPGIWSVLNHAFTKGTTSAQEVRSALGEYFYQENEVPIGHVEDYFICSTPIEYLCGVDNDLFSFYFDHKGMLIKIGSNNY